MEIIKYANTLNITQQHFFVVGDVDLFMAL